MWLRDRAIGDRASEKSESIGMTSLASGSSLRVSMGFTVSRQMAPKFTVNRQKKGYFCGQLSKKQVKINQLTISADLPGIQAPRAFLNRRSQFPCSQKHSF